MNPWHFPSLVRRSRLMLAAAAVAAALIASSTLPAGPIRGVPHAGALA